ncbi:MAG: serine/threonine-protein phosphatase [Roseiflexus sp.]|jgi:serine/threonine protein phosphatase PrpC|nr:serine/threonine-protein phosphatase [Roseiflexus sp.]MBO9335912.1 serine/threonine-protein phosphatase [Roseiflexus sp.]MBO9365981.1 serine/threonine-protein phosphatase [Roseiflexus sp.]MBO9383273.1 serine/threonine-protein phosphatase [Roseiflexus sp.]MBO9390224.1 serine/threonine-protein phosphatase [Roseiflexus sp.]
MSTHTSPEQPDNLPPDQSAAWRSDDSSDSTRPLDTRAVMAQANQDQRPGATEPLDDNTLPRETPPPPPAIVAAAMRHIGQIRETNQDSIYTLISSIPRETGDAILGLFIVADGMGGHEGGEIASRMAVSAVARRIIADLLVPAVEGAINVSLQALMVEAVQEANRTIWNQAQLTGSDMGTTCTAALLLGHSLYISHVGDTRAYLIDTHGIHQLTSDHSAVGRLIDMGQLDPSEARDHPLRSHLYRTVGQHPEIAVDLVFQPIGDATHLLLASDGLWGCVDDAAMLRIIQTIDSPQRAVRALVDAANRAGGPDNISAVLVRLV